MPKQKRLSLLGVLVVTGVVVLILFIFFPSLPDPKCAALLVRSESDVAIPLPDNCMLTTDAAADQVVKYLENERKQRGLVFKAWIHCNPSSQAQTEEFAFTHDPPLAAQLCAGCLGERNKLGSNGAVWERMHAISASFGAYWQGRSRVIAS